MFLGVRYGLSGLLAAAGNDDELPCSNRISYELEREMPREERERNGRDFRDGDPKYWTHRHSFRDPLRTPWVRARAIEGDSSPTSSLRNIASAAHHRGDTRRAVIRIVAHLAAVAIRLAPVMDESAQASGEAGPYSAAGSALGYLAQAEYALLLMLKRMDDVVDLEVSIETLDDIVFHAEGTPSELLQTKHSVNQQASLTNASTDLWKTIHNWIQESWMGDSELVLLTTATASDGTAASRLRADSGRDVGQALQDLERAARESASQTNEDYYAAFLGLEPDQRRNLVERIVVVDHAAAAADLTNALELAVRKATAPARRTALVERLRGWWHGRVMEHLTRVARKERDRITMAEVEAQLYAFAQSLRDENLPIEFEEMAFPDEAGLDEDIRIFVEQLRLLAMGSKRMRQCIYDHNRAFAQRSSGQRERLLKVGELGAYDRRLQDEWRRYFTPLSDEQESSDQDAVRARARESFHALDTSALPPIRREVSAGFVANGSLHILADRLKIGWHPAWLEHLKHRIGEVQDEMDTEAA